AELFGHVVDVVEQIGDAAVAPQETGDTADSNVAPGVSDGLNHLVRFAANVGVNRRGHRVAGDDGLRGNLGGFQAGLPAGMGAVGDDADAVHLGDGGASKIAEAGIGGFGAAVADHVSPLVGQVHHADAEMVEDAYVAKLVGGGEPVLSEGDAVAGEIEAVLAGPLGGLD